MYPGSDISLYPSLSAGLWQESHRRLGGAEGTAEQLSTGELATACMGQCPPLLSTLSHWTVMIGWERIYFYAKTRA